MGRNAERLKSSFDRESRTYDGNSSTFHHRICSHIVENLLLEDLLAAKPQKVLDAGGGTGKYSLLLAKAGYATTLIDISSGQVEVARGKIKAENLDIPCFVGNCEETVFQNESFDFILCVGAVFSYTPDPERLLTELRRILRPNGILWFDFFHAGGWAWEVNDLATKLLWAGSENRDILMEDWDYPAKIMSLRFVRELLKARGFEVLKEYGLISLSHSLSLSERYTEDYSEDLLNQYCELELKMSRNPEYLGTSWSCIVMARKLS